MRAACHAFAAWSNVGADTARLSPRGSGMRPAGSSDSTNAARILASRMVRNEPAKRAARVRRQDQREPVLSTEPVEEPHQVDDGAFLVCVASVRLVVRVEDENSRPMLGPDLLQRDAVPA